MKQTIQPRIRQANKTDCAQLAAMRWDFKIEEHDIPICTQEEFIQKCTAFLCAELKSDRWAYWIAEYDDEIISHIFVYRVPKIPEPSNLDDSFGYVTNVYTKPAYRNQGIGSLLMAAVKKWSLTQRMELLIVWPSQRSIPFYKRAGFLSADNFLQCTINEQ
jgi:GNAT superfamily N-acetyltransferase